MRNKILNGGLLLILAILIATPGGNCQIIFGQPASTDLQMVFTGWSLKYGDSTSDINQLMFPLNGFVPLGENFEANFYMANSSNKLNQPAANLDLSGLSDFRIQLNHSFLDDAFLLSGGVNLPTGKKKLNPGDQWTVIEFLSRDFLSFPMSRFGEGFGFNLLIGGARMLGQFKCGGGITYQFNGPYKPLADGLDYNPGDLLSANADAEWQKNSAKFNADIIGTLYTSDKMDGKKDFKQGSQLDLRLSGLYDKRPYSFGGSLRYLVRGRNTRYGIDEAVVEQLKIYGNEFGASGRISLAFNEWVFSPMGEVRMIAKNEDNFGNSKIYGFGGSLDKKIGANAAFGFSFEYLTGNADGGKIDLSGYRLTSHLAASL